MSLLTSSLIRPSYTIRVIIFEKVFLPKKFLKTEYFPTKRIISLTIRTCKFSSRTFILYIPPWIHFIEFFNIIHTTKDLHKIIIIQDRAELALGRQKNNTLLHLGGRIWIFFAYIFFCPPGSYNALIASLLRWEGKRDRNFKKGRIKCHKEYSNTSPQ